MSNQEIGERLIELRRERGLTQAQVADAMHMKQNQLSRLEKGERSLTIQTLQEFAEYYKVTTDYLLGLTNNSSINADVQAVCACTGLSQKAAEALCVQPDFRKIAEESSDEINCTEEKIASYLKYRYDQQKRSKSIVLSALLEYDMDNTFFDRLLDYFESDYIKFANSSYEADQAREGDIDMDDYISGEYNFSGAVTIRNKKRRSLAYVGSPTFVDAVLLHAVENEINRIRKKYRDDNMLPWLK